MTTLYWFLEYAKVFLAYIFVFGVWPLVVFEKTTKNKSLTFKFAFCVAVMPVAISSVVLGLGLFHLLYRWIVFVIFYGLFFYKVYKRIEGKYDFIGTLKRIVEGTYGHKSFSRNISRRVKIATKRMYNSFMYGYSEQIMSYVLLAIIVIFGVTYFSYGSFQDYTYGSLDLYVHASWINGLTNGEIFSAGVYPEGLHSVVYLLYAVFGIKTFNGVLFLGGIHTLTFIVSIYIFFKEIFKYKYSPHLAITFFLILEFREVNQILSMARLQWALPQEFGLHTPFLCAAFLVRYFKSGDVIVIDRNIDGLKNKLIAYFKTIMSNQNLLVFALSLSSSMVIHFYPTIMIMFMFVAFIIVYIRKALNPKHLAVLAFMSVLAVVIAVLPMAGALASGTPLQSSVNWAIELMNENEKIDSDIEEILDEGEDTDLEINETGIKILDGLKYSGFYALYNKYRGRYFAIWTIFSFLVFVTCRVRVTWRKYRNSHIPGYDEDETKYDLYFSLIVALIIYMIMYSPSVYNLPALIETYRLCSSINVLLLGVCIIPYDVLMYNLDNMTDRTKEWIGVASVFCAYIAVRSLGLFHGYLYCEMTRYNAAVDVTEDLIRTMPQDSFTIVSPVDELYQLKEYGFHEELLSFANNCVMDNYTLPTEYVFLYVEKRPLKRSQFNFFEGPKWLAAEKNASIFGKNASEGTDYIRSTASSELARPPFTYYQGSLSAYSNFMSRTVLESRIKEWCREFGDLYPDEMHTFYEDENFVCYYFRQNPNCLYQLAFQNAYTENNAKGIWD